MDQPERSSRWRRLPWYLEYRVLPRALSQARKIQVVTSHLHCHVEFQGAVHLGPGFRLDIPDGGTLIVGNGVDFRQGFFCQISGQGRVVIGAGTIFTSNAMIQCSTQIEIGRRCAIGQSVLIVDGYHRYEDPDRHWLDQGYNYRPVRIGDGVGISDKCTVQADIGDWSMVASQSVVNRPLPAHCVAAGSPARVIRRLDPKGDGSESSDRPAAPTAPPPPSGGE